MEIPKAKHCHWMFHPSWWVILLLGAGVGGDDKVAIKIVEAPALSRFPSMPGSHDSKLTLRVKPAILSGPPHLLQLAGRCFETKVKGYTYNVCPFQNVTQKEDRVAWNSFHGVLGVWQEWLIENDTFIGMLFTKGDHCSSDDRAVKVLFNCSTVTRLHSITEPLTCKYIIWMDTPLACFKGAMQVYHLLTPDQLKRWDQLEEEYYGGEITRQGLERKRRMLFIEAGLLRDPELVKQEDQPSRNVGDEQPHVGFISPFASTPLQLCEQRSAKCQGELNELMWDIRALLQDYPDLESWFPDVVDDQGTTATEGPIKIEGGVENSKPVYEQLDITTDHADDGKEDVAGGGRESDREEHKELKVGVERGEVVTEVKNVHRNNDGGELEEPLRLAQHVPQEVEHLRDGVMAQEDVLEAEGTRHRAGDDVALQRGQAEGRDKEVDEQLLAALLEEGNADGKRLD